METTPNLDLPYIMPSQAQKHVTHNEAIRALDAIVHLSVKSRAVTDPPGTPGDGDRYLVPASANGAWSGFDNQIAAFQDSAWAFYPPSTGWAVWVEDEETALVRTDTSWKVLAADDASFETLSVNGAIADTTNRIAVNAPASLLNNDGSGHQLTINKNAPGDTASVLFQTGFSGRAEFGLAGDDNWHVKVSADGANWLNALSVDKDTGYVGLGGDPEQRLHLIGDGEPSVVILETYGVNNQLFARAADGTKASPAATISGRLMFSFSALGHDGADWTSAVALGSFRADETFSETAQGTRFALELTPKGSTTRTEVLRIDGQGNLRVEGPVRAKSYTVATLPSAAGSGAGAMIHVSDEAGGSVMAFSDGAAWRRVTDRAVVS